MTRYSPDYKERAAILFPIAVISIIIIAIFAFMVLSS